MTLFVEASSEVDLGHVRLKIEWDHPLRVANFHRQGQREGSWATREPNKFANKVGGMQGVRAGRVTAVGGGAWQNGGADLCPR